MYDDKLDGKIDATFYERMSTSWREEQSAASVKSSSTRPRTSPTWMKGCGFSNSHGTRGISSKGRNPEKSGDSSISWFRTSRGRAVILPPPYANPLIFWPKQRLRSKRERPPAVSPTALLRFGSPGRTRTSDQAVNSRSLYQLSYRGSGRLAPQALSPWRPEAESNRCTRICSPLHSHSAIRPTTRHIGVRREEGQARRPQLPDPLTLAVAAARYAPYIR